MTNYKNSPTIIKESITYQGFYSYGRVDADCPPRRMTVNQPTTPIQEQTPTSGACAALNEEELIRRVEVVIGGRTRSDGVLIPALQTVQNLCGYLPKGVLHYLSERLGIPYSEVTGVVSFYSFFSTVPRGRNLVRVCLGTACYVRGGQEVLEGFRRTLGIAVGETTPDRQFSLEVGRCFGACGLSPVVMVNETVHQRVRPARIKELLAKYQERPEGGAK